MKIKSQTKKESKAKKKNKGIEVKQNLSEKVFFFNLFFKLVALYVF